MGYIVDGHSGKRKFFKGRGRSGTKKLDDYQQMLIEQEKLNQLEEVDARLWRPYVPPETPPKECYAIGPRPRGPEPKYKNPPSSVLASYKGPNPNKPLKPKRRRPRPHKTSGWAGDDF
jgi:hypothetical protein